MSMSVTVLLPNGRRQQINTSPQTAVLQVIEEICGKQNLNADKYALKYHNHVLNTSSTLQFSGVANNAQLELVSLPKERQQAPVQISLQLESGGRLSGTFIPSDTLRDVIVGLCSAETANKPDPVIVYARQEVHGDKLDTTTLKSLGLTGGSVLLRLLHRTPEQLSTQCVAPSTSKKAKLDDKESGFFKNVFSKIEEKIADLSEKIPKRGSERKGKNEEQGQKAKSMQSSEQKADHKQSPTAAVKMEITEVEKPKGKTEERLQLTGKSFKDEEKSEFDETAAVAESSCKIDEDYINSVKYIGNRYNVLFLLDGLTSPKYKDPEDEFFEVTTDDVRMMLRDVKALNAHLQDMELSTRDMREKKKQEKLEKIMRRYWKCVVRVVFPNRVVLQGVFDWSDIVADIIHMVSDFLVDPKMDFVLFTSPPKVILKPTDTLLHLGAPGLLMYFGTPKSSSDSPHTQFLKPEFSDQLVDPIVAQNVANFFRKPRRESSVSDNLPDSDQCALRT